MTDYDNQHPGRRLALLYLLAGCLWIYLSDQALALISNPRLHTLLSIGKGWLFVLATAMLLYAFVDRWFAQRQKLRQADENRYRAVVEDQTENICRYRPDGTLIFVNDVYCRQFGKPAAELVGSRWHPNAHADDISLIEAKLGKMSAANPVVVIENRVYTADQEIRWMQFVNRGFFDENGNLLETLAVGRDITERKQMEERQRESDIRFAALFHADFVAVGFSHMATNCFVDVNDAFLSLFGFTRGEVIGKTSLELGLWPVPEERDAMLAALERSGRVERCEAKYRHKSGRIGDLRVSAQIIELQGERFLVGMLSDISEQKLAEKALQGYARRLMDMDEELRRSLARELHDEVGRDLTALGLSLTYVRSQLPEELRCKLADRLEDAEVIMETIGRTIRHMMTDLRPPVLEDYGLPAALRWQCEQFTRRTDLPVNLQLADDFPRLPPDRELALFRIAQEALHNVAKHARATTVELLLTRERGEVRMSIVDNGAGFDPDATTRPISENSWGITIMEERARAVGATATLSSTPGRGTCVSVAMGGAGL